MTISEIVLKIAENFYAKCNGVYITVAFISKNKEAINYLAEKYDLIDMSDTYDTLTDRVVFQQRNDAT